MSPLSCLLATTYLIAPTCRGVMGVLRPPAMMVLVSFYPLVTSWGLFFVGHWLNASRSSPQNVADQGQKGRLSNLIDDRNRLSRVGKLYWVRTVRAPVRARGYGVGRRARCRCVAKRVTALKAIVLHACAWNGALVITLSPVQRLTKRKVEVDRHVFSRVIGCTGHNLSSSSAVLVMIHPRHRLSAVLVTMAKIANQTWSMEKVRYANADTQVPEDENNKEDRGIGWIRMTPPASMWRGSK